MSFEIIFRVEAELDIADSCAYYEKISPSITDGFLIELYETIEFIETEPTLFQQRYRGIRIAPLYRFPYGIHYIEEDNRVIIFRVLHTKRYFK